MKKGGRIQRIQLRCTQAELEYAAACGASWRDLAELVGCTDRTLRNWRWMTRDFANDIDAQRLSAEMVDVLRTAALGGDTRAAIHLLERLDRQDRQEEEADAEAERRRYRKR